MAKKAISKGKSTDSSDLTIQQAQGETPDRALARTALCPSLQSAVTVRDYNKLIGEPKLMCLIDELQFQIDQTIGGDMGRAEAMLTTQAHVLDAIFNNLARRAANSEYLSNFDTFLRLGLRAQSQCRATWESLALIKNPVGRAYVGQANFAHNQQINNSGGSARTREKQNLPNELLGKKDYEPSKWLDGGTPEEAIRTDQNLETVGEIDGPKVA